MYAVRTPINFRFCHIFRGTRRLGFWFWGCNFVRQIRLGLVLGLGCVDTHTKWVGIFRYVYNLLHMLKIEKQIRDRVFLSSYIYVCACDSECVRVQVCRCVFIYGEGFLQVISYVYVCVCESVCVCV